MSYGTIIDVPTTSYYLLAAQQDPLKKGLSLNEKHQRIKKKYIKKKEEEEEKSQSRTCALQGVTIACPLKSMARCHSARVSSLIRDHLEMHLVEWVEEITKKKNNNNNNNKTTTNKTTPPPHQQQQLQIKHFG